MTTQFERLPLPRSIEIIYTIQKLFLSTHPQSKQTGYLINRLRMLISEVLILFAIKKAATWYRQQLNYNYGCYYLIPDK